MSSKVLENNMVVPNIRKLVLQSPGIATAVKPGQFVVIMVDEKSERVPLTLADWDDNEESLTMFYLDVGRSTKKISELQSGDSLFAVAGPLGKPVELRTFGRVLLGAGCYGLGAIYPIAKKLKQLSNEIVLVIEARSSYLIYNEEKLGRVVDDLVIYTADGTRGEKGHVWNALEKMQEEGEHFDHAFFIGCTFMLMKSSKNTKLQEIPTSVSLNALMVDATGMCGACRVSVGGEMLLTCVDGPTFDGHKVDWELLFARSNAYSGEENLIYQYPSSPEESNRRARLKDSDCHGC